MTLFTAWLGLGANLGEAETTLRLAVHALRSLPNSQLFALSSLYQSAPIGPANQPDYLNAVAGLRTPLTPHALLQALHRIENTHGRERHERWGARTLDLDILLYANDRIETSNLVIPHQELCHRNFVVIPLLEVWPEAQLPSGISLQQLSTATQWEGLRYRHQGSAWGS